MPMPDRDPTRFVEAVLADPTHKLPLPDRGYRMFMDDGELIDLHNPFYAALLADGSLILKPQPVFEPAAETPADDIEQEKPAAGVRDLRAPEPLKSAKASPALDAKA